MLWVVDGVWAEINRRLTLWDFARRIRRHGWTGTYVYDDACAFSYSIGFWEALEQPEVIMFGVPLEPSNHLLWKIFHDLKSGELSIADKAVWDLGWEEWPALAWRAVDPSQIRREHFNIAIWYRERQGRSRYGLSAWQLVFPDAAGAFPWEETYDQDYRPRQPELWLPYFGPPEED